MQEVVVARADQQLRFGRVHSLRREGKAFHSTQKLKLPNVNHRDRGMARVTRATPSGRRLLRTLWCLGGRHDVKGGGGSGAGGGAIFRR